MQPEVFQRLYQQYGDRGDPYFSQLALILLLFAFSGYFISGGVLVALNEVAFHCEMPIFQSRSL